MKSLIAGLFIVLGLMGGAYYYYNIYPPNAQKNIIQTSLDRFAEAVASKDRAQVGDALNNLLADDAKIRLEVYMFSIRQNSRPPFMQDFEKPQFIQFIDNILYPLSDYSYTPELTHYDHATGEVRFISREWADGANMMGGIAVDMRYSSETVCEGAAVIEGEVAKLRHATCKMQFRQVPKPGQTGKLQNVKSLQDLLAK